MLFKWSDEYSCHVKEIDKQHKKLFEIGERLSNLVEELVNEQCNNCNKISNLFNELIEYAIYHFDTEEKLMKETSYDDYENHKKEHVMFIEKLSNTDLQKFETNQNEAVRDLLTFVGKWILSHIFNIDMKYMIHFEKYSIV